MGNCEQLFAIMGVIFPNRIRAMLADCSITGLSGPYPQEMLDKIGRQIAACCPSYSRFHHGVAANTLISANRQLVRVPPHPDMVVRFIHFDHQPDTACEVLALAAGPPDAIALLRDDRSGSLPLSRREMQLTLALAAGQTLHDVARDAGISISTVRNQVKNAMRATSTHSQAHLATVVRDWLL